LLFNVSAGSFMPAPKVDSCVIRLDVSSEPTVSVIDDKSFFRVVKGAFAQRRKTLSNSMSSSMGIDKQTVKAILEKAGIPENARAEQLKMEQIANIADALYQSEKGEL
jgi:16S rRNA (adenine1518-N6/adenine1519-N6)-dimethyltransferase